MKKLIVPLFLMTLVFLQVRIGVCAVTFTKASSQRIPIGTGQISALLNGASGATISAWINISSGTLNAHEVQVNISSNAGATGIALLEGPGSNQLQCGARSKSTDASQTGTVFVFTPGQDYHMMCVFDFAGDTIKTYINGVLRSSVSPTWGSTTYVDGVPTSADQLGSNGATSPTIFMDGKLSDIRIWKIALTSQDAKTLFGSRSRIYLYTDKMIRYWPLDEGTAGATVGTILDRSQYQSTSGTAVNGPLFSADKILDYP